MVEGISQEGLPVDEADHGPTAASTAAHTWQDSAGAADSSVCVVPHAAATCDSQITTILLHSGRTKSWYVAVDKRFVRILTDQANRVSSDYPIR